MYLKSKAFLICVSFFCVTSLKKEGTNKVVAERLRVFAMSNRVFAMSTRGMGGKDAISVQYNKYTLTIFVTVQYNKCKQKKRVKMIENVAKG